MAAFKTLEQICQSQQYYKCNNNNEREIGQKLLDFLLYKVVFLELGQNNKFVYEKFKNNFSSEIIKYITTDRTDHLQICMGNIAKYRQYQTLKQLQNQLTIIIKLQSAITEEKNCCQILNENFIVSNNFDIPLNDSFTLSNQYSFTNQLYFPLKMQKIKHHQNALQQKNKNLSKYQKLYNIAFEESNISSNTETQKKQNNSQVQSYLETQIHSYKSQLNLVIQQMKLIRGEWKEGVVNKQRTQQYILTVPSTFTGDQQIKIKGYGKNINKKIAGENAALTILKILYQKFPNIFNKIVEIKRIKCVKT